MVPGRRMRAFALQRSRFERLVSSPAVTDRSRELELIINTERRVLQALCRGTRGGSVRDVGKLLLQNYRWREASHQAIFDALISIPSEDPLVIRDQLPSRITRRGFPDVAWEEIFKAHGLSKDEAERLMRQLVKK